MIGDDEYEQLHSAIHGRFDAAAICIQNLVSSRESASHDTSRTSLRPSSITKPRYPSLSVVSTLSTGGAHSPPPLCSSRPSNPNDIGISEWEKSLMAI